MAPAPCVRHSKPRDFQVKKLAAVAILLQNTPTYLTADPTNKMTPTNAKYSLRQQGSPYNLFAEGTHLTNCKCYKLVAMRAKNSLKWARKLSH